VETMRWFHRMNTMREKKGWTLAELSKRSGVDYESIAKYSRGEVDKPRGSTIGKIAYALDTTEQVLLFGVDSRQKLTNYAGLQPELHGTKRIPRITLLELANIKAGQEPFSVWPGEMSMMVDEGIDSDCIAVDVEDDSMSPDFSPGDTLICDPNAEIKPGNFVLAKANGQPKALIRKYRVLGKCAESGALKIELKPINEDYPSDFIDNDHPGHIIARCFKVIKQL
jgi:transcriptional regulator with XRE-family HTH domain